MAARGEVKPRGGRPAKDRERRTFYLDAELVEWLRGVAKPSELVNRLLRDEMMTMRGGEG